MADMTAAQRLLQKKHGTPDEFERAVYQCVGEISLGEAMQAVAKYKLEWTTAGLKIGQKSMKNANPAPVPPPPYLITVRPIPAPRPVQWLKIILHLRLDMVDYKQRIAAIVLQFEREFGVKHLYYARYTTLESSTVEIAAETYVARESIRKFFLAIKDVRAAVVETRDTGSYAHAYAYQAVKRLPPYEKDLAEDDAFLDLIHWTANQRGLDYIREARAYTYATLRILHKTALESSQNIAAMREFNRKSRHLSTMEDIADRLNLLAPKKDKSHSVKARVRQRQPKMK
jgi:hypothetical protein